MPDLFLWDVRNHSAKLPTLRSFYLRHSLDFDPHRTQTAPNNPLANHFFFRLPKSFSRDHSDTNSIACFLNDLTFQQVWQINEDAVKAHHLPSVQTHNDIFQAAYNLL